MTAAKPRYDCCVDPRNSGRSILCVYVWRKDAPFPAELRDTYRSRRQAAQWFARLLKELKPD